MDPQPAAPGVDASSDAPGGIGLSEFVGKVLDQLSLSAWIPASMGVGLGAVLAQVSQQPQLDVGGAFADLTEQTLGVLIVLVFGVVLATAITQAFQFEFIRLMEGYWGIGRLATWMGNRRIESHLTRRAEIVDELKSLRWTAFQRARARMVEAAVDRTLLDILENDILGRANGGTSQNKLAEARSMGWRPAALPTDLRRIDALQRRLNTYPDEHRLLSTRLGNTLRAAEDGLKIADGGDLQGYILRNHHRLPHRLRVQHGQYRTRLDMYCTLVFIFLALTPASVWALWRFGPSHIPSVIAAAGLLALALLCRAAAIASARGYGGVLRAIDDHLMAAATVS